MPTSPDIALRVNGETYTGWSEVEYTASLERFPDTFSLSAPDFAAARAIPAGARCEVLSRGRVLLTGEIEQADYTEGKGGHGCHVAGRSLPYHLLKSCAPAGDYSGLDPVQIAERFGAPWNLSVYVGHGGAVSPVRRLRVKAGERGWEHLQRLADAHAHCWVCTPSGGLAWMRPGSESTDTIIGLPNCSEFRFGVDLSNRYETIQVRGQMATDDMTYGADAQSTSDADGGLSNGDVLILRNGMPVDQGTCRDRALWEAATRLGQSIRVTATMPHLHTAEGDPWRVGLLAPVRSGWLGLNTRMVVSEVAFKFGADSGSACTLGVRLPESYLPKPVQPARGKGQRKSGRWTELDGEYGQ